MGDTDIVDATPGPCRPAMNSTKATPIVYSCSDDTIYFDRVDPVHRSSFRYTEVVQEKKTVCVQYETTASGQQRCVRTSQVVTDKPISRTGALHAYAAVRTTP
jgi:hypothetical protein